MASNDILIKASENARARDEAKSVFVDRLFDDVSDIPQAATSASPPEAPTGFTSPLPAGDTASEEDDKPFFDGGDLQASIVRGATNVPREITRAITDDATAARWAKFWSEDLERSFHLLGENAPTFEQAMDLERHPTSTVGSVAEPMTQALTGFAALSLVASTLPFGAAAMTAHPLVSSTLGGAVVDGVMFDPRAERLANMLAAADSMPNVQAVGEALEYDPESAGWVNRGKSSVEGGVLGLVGTSALWMAGKVGRHAGLPAAAWIYRKAAPLEQLNKLGKHFAVRLVPLDPAIAARLNGSAHSVVAHRNFVDDLVTMTEWQESLSSGAPGMQEAMSWLRLPRAERRAKEKLSAEAFALIETAEFMAKDSSLDTTLEVLTEIAARADHQSPMALLAEVDPELAERVLTHMAGDGLGAPGTTAELTAVLGEQREALRLAEMKWNQTLLSDDFGTLLPAEQTALIEAVEASRRGPAQGFRPIQETEDARADLIRALEHQQRTLPGINAARSPTPLEVERGAKPPIERKTVSVLGTALRLTTEQRHDLLAAIKSGDVHQAAGILADHTNLFKLVAGTGKGTEELHRLLQGLSNLAEEGDGTNALRGLASLPKHDGTEAGEDALLAVLDEASASGIRSSHQTHVPLETQYDIGEALANRASHLGWEKPSEMVKAMRQLTGRTAEEGGTLHLYGDLTAVRILEAAILKRTLKLAAEMPNGNLRTKAEFIQTADLARRINDLRRGMITDVGRALGSLRNKVDIDNVDADGIADLIREAGGSPDTLAKALREAPPNDIGEIADATLWEKSKRSAYSLWINSMLSGPRTHSSNTVSNAGAMFLNPTGRMLSGALYHDAAAVAEGGRMITKTLASFGMASRMAGRALRNNEGVLVKYGQSVPGLPNNGPLDDLEYWAGNKAGAQSLAHRLVHAANILLGSPSRLLIAGDEWAKNMNYMGEADRLVKRYVESNRPDLFGMNLDAEVKRVVAQIGRWHELSNVADSVAISNYKSMHEAAVEHAKKYTFTNDLGKGTAGEAMFAARKVWGPLRLFTPFVKTPVNIMRMGSSYVPGLNLLIRAEREQIQAAFANGANSPEARAMVAKMAMGTAAISHIVGLVAEGRITGRGPSNPAHRETWKLHYKEYSYLSANGNWVELRRLQPFGFFIGAVADVVNVIGEVEDGETDELATAVYAALLTNMSNATFTRGMFESMHMLEHPDTGVPRFVESMAGTAGVPMSMAIREWNRQAGDTTRRQSGQPAEEGTYLAAIDALLPVTEALDGVYGVIPGQSEKKAALLGIDGKPVIKPVTVWYDAINPLYFIEAQDDPRMQKLADLHPAWTRKSFKTIGGVELTPEQQNDWIMLQGEGLIPRLLTAMESENFDELETQAQRAVLEDIIGLARARGEKGVMALHPKLQAAVTFAELERRPLTNAGRAGAHTEDAILRIIEKGRSSDKGRKGVESINAHIAKLRADNGVPRTEPY